MFCLKRPPSLLQKAILETLQKTQDKNQIKLLQINTNKNPNFETNHQSNENKLKLAQILNKQI